MPSRGGYSAPHGQLRHRRAGQAARGPSTPDGSGPLHRRRQRARSRPTWRSCARRTPTPTWWRSMRRRRAAVAGVLGVFTGRDLVADGVGHDPDAHRGAGRRHPEPRRVAVRGAAVVSARDGSRAPRRRARGDRRRRRRRRRRRTAPTPWRVRLRGAAAGRRRRRRPRGRRAAPCTPASPRNRGYDWECGDADGHRARHRGRRPRHAPHAPRQPPRHLLPRAARGARRVGRRGRALHASRVAPERPRARPEPRAHPRRPHRARALRDRRRRRRLRLEDPAVPRIRGARVGGAPARPSAQVGVEPRRGVPHRRPVARPRAHGRARPRRGAGASPRSACTRRRTSAPTSRRGCRSRSS